MNNDLKSFKQSILLSILFPLFISVVITSLLFFMVHQQNENERKQLSQQKLEAANQIFQSSLSEKLAIIASSTVFMDFISSGEVTRNEIMPSFLKQLRTLHSESIVGLKIWHAFDEKALIFDNGMFSNQYVTLKLCYLGNRLDSQYGSCDYYFRLYLSMPAIISELKKINSDIQWCRNCTPINVIPGHHFGSFKIYDKSTLSIPLKISAKRENFFYYYLIAMAILLFFAFLNSSRIHHVINTVISKPLADLVNKIKNNTLPKPSAVALSEINYLVEQIENWTKQLETMRKIENQAAIGELMAQLAHDIRSPLSALEMGMQSINALPEEMRILIRNAVWRIHDLANSLLEASNHELSSAINQNNPSSQQLLSSLINMLVTEKRLQYQAKPLIEIESRLDASSYGLFAMINVSDFKRMLSNLINNAVEALNEEGKVLITLTSVEDKIKIIIEDNGKGIPAAILHKLGQRGLTHDKQGGSGLGLYHAKTSVQNWQGELQINSILQKGTTITLLLPRKNPPSWFVPAIFLMPKQYLIVIDDDASVHEIWKNRILKFLESVQATIYLKHFYYPNEVRIWMKNREDKLPATFLCDYEFIGYPESGIDLIKHLNIINQSKLVTSRFENTNIVKECEILGIGIIPKDLARLVPISLLEDRQIDAVLIDDDPLIHSLWSLAAKKHHKNIKLFFNVGEFFSACKDFSPNIPIYIDSNLGNGIQGEIIAEEIYFQGFTNLHLTTGHDSLRFRLIPYLKGITGKDPPWK